MTNPDILARARPKAENYSRAEWSLRQKGQSKTKGKYRKDIGDKWERICINWLEEHHFGVVKACLSRGVFDFIAIPPDYDWRVPEHKKKEWDWIYERVLSIQAKFSGNMTAKERIKLYNKSRSHGSHTKIVIMFMREDGSVGFKRFS